MHLSNIYSQFLKFNKIPVKYLHQENKQQIRYLSSSSYKYKARRAILYVPGDDERKLNKATKLNVDCIVVDCEDGVSINRKDNARQSIRNFFNKILPTTIKTDTQNTEWAVRVNSRSSNLLAEDLHVIIVSAEHRPNTLFLPKCESADDIKFFNEELGRCISTKNINSNSQEPVQLIFYVESARAMLNLPDICQTAHQLSTNFKLFQPAAIVFGSDDFCANIGATRTEDSQEILYARQKCVLVAKAFNLQAIDMVYIQFKDLDGLKKQCITGAQMGYTGKQIIHPGQIDVVQMAFLPSSERLEWAQGIVKAFDDHKKIGKGAFVYRNQMIDMPTVKQAYIQHIKFTQSNFKVDLLLIICDKR